MNGSTFSGFAYFGNFDSRSDGHRKVFNFNGTSNMTIDNIWIEHQMCLYWGANTDNLRGIEQGRAAGHPVELLVNGLAKMSEVSSLDALQASRACG